MTTFPAALSQALRDLGVKTHHEAARLLGLHMATWTRNRNGVSPTSATMAKWLRRLHEEGYPLRATWGAETGWMVTQVEVTP